MNVGVILSGFRFQAFEPTVSRNGWDEVLYDIEVVKSKSSQSPSYGSPRGNVNNGSVVEAGSVSFC